MSHFGEKLRETLKSKNMSGMKLARKTGISQGQISRWTRGSQAWIGKEHLSTIARCITASAAEQAELIAAHLRDEADMPQLQAAARMIGVEISGKPVRQSAVGLEVPTAFLKTFQILAASVVRDHRVAAILNNLAELEET